MKEEEQKQYPEYMLEWCNSIYSYWVDMKPRFSKLSDERSLEEWEDSLHVLKEKLRTDLKMDVNDYQVAKNLYERCEQLYNETSTYQKEGEIKEDQISRNS